MTEPIFLRVRRILSANAEEAVDALERASGAGVLREAIRQVAQALADVRAEQDAAVARGAQTRTRQGRIRERLADLDEKARFALGKDRDDLAEAALSRQIELEAEAKRLKQVEADAAADAVRLEACASELIERKAQMEKELAAFETARREDAIGADARMAQDQAIRRKVERAQETFDRVVGGTATGAVGRTDAKEAEIEALRKEAVVAERLAALRAKAQPEPKRRARS